jgi:Flp pilus assembly pilin Flp
MRHWHRRIALLLGVLNRRRKAGQALIEYSLIFALIIVVVLVTLITVGNQLLMTYEDIEEAVTNLGGASSQVAFTCPDGTPAVQHGHRYWCHP